jgi:hypothetical protein
MNTNDHGHGFYKLCERLGLGSARSLHDRLFGFEEARRCRDYWQDVTHYQTAFVNQESEQGFLGRNGTSATDIRYFNIEDLQFFESWKGRVYNPDDDNHRAAKDRIMHTVWEQTIYLGKQVEQRLSGFLAKGKRIWHQRGWDLSDEQSRQAAIFKGYTWIKLMRNTDREKDIFFTLGLDADKQSFIYKIDCQHERDSAMSRRQIETCQQMIPEHLQFEQISHGELLQMNWESLTDFCTRFVMDNTYIYDEIVAAVWEDRLPIGVIQSALIEQPIPEGFASTTGMSDPWEPMPNNTNPDYIGQAIRAKELGDKGENLVLLHERRHLQANGRHDLADQVHKMPDGQGFDIASFDKSGNPIKIEVKTTTHGAKTPFYMSDPEVRYLRTQPEGYFIYRLYAYDEAQDLANFYKLTGNLSDQLLFKPIQYLVSVI